MLPESIGELGIFVGIPAGVEYMMPGFSRSKRHGFNKWSADVTMLNRERSRTLLTVSNFLLAELGVDNAGESGRDGDVVEVDPTDIASEIHWKYAVDVIKPDKIGSNCVGCSYYMP
jgi:zearalenone synthase (highly reducing iterative type I polyketide synthase)